MFEQLTQLVQQYGDEAIVKNNAIPNEQNEAVLNETSNSIFSSLQKIATNGNLSQFAELLKGNDLNDTNPTVQEITNTVNASLTEKFGMSNSAASGVTTNMIPQILSSLIEKAKDPKDGSFNLSDIISSLTGGDTAQNSGIMEAISTYGIHFGLDENKDGKVDLDDMAAFSKKGGIAGMFQKLFGK
ncbi:MAG: hypothetical protein V4572_08450 [Bacteroidota bacterium]